MTKQTKTKPAQPEPRPTKTETVRALLLRPEGASLDAICEATGWQRHSARAALSGLRKAGDTIARATGEGRADGSGATYRITAARKAPA